MHRILAVTAVAAGILIGLFIATGAAQGQLTLKVAQPVVDLNNPAFEPFQKVVNCFEANIDGDLCFAPAIVTVPDGNRLVIEYLSGKIAFLGNNIKLTTIAGGEQATYSFPLASDGTLEGTLVRIYADPRSRVIVWSNEGPGPGFGELVISGHLVKLPTN